MSGRQPQPLPIARLLEAHRRDVAASTLPENLGDGTLCRRNVIYGAMREAAVAAGFQFTLDDEYGYFAWPLVSLTRMLERKRIPYRRSHAAFAALEASRPGFFTTRHTELVEPQVNVLLHESAHGVADQAWLEAAPRGQGLSQAHRVVLRYTLGEAFANATELVAMAHTGTAEERWLLALNSYWAHLPELPRAWWRLDASIGGRAAARWLILGFLTANLCRETVTPKLRRELLELAQIDLGVAQQAPVRAGLDLLTSEAMNLNLDFRTHTAQMFYASLGLTPDIAALTSFDFVAALRGDEALLQMLERLAGMLGVARSQYTQAPPKDALAPTRPIASLPEMGRSE